MDDLESSYYAACGSQAASPFREMLNSLGLSETEFRTVVERSPWRKEFEEVIPGVHEFLAKLQSRYRLGTIANQVLGTRERLKERGLLPFFSLLVSSAEVGCAKPDPRIFRHALEQANCPPERAVMIGDRIENDIRPARLIGMKTIRMVWDFSSSARFQHPRDEWDTADFTARNMDEIAEVLGVAP